MVREQVCPSCCHDARIGVEEAASIQEEEEEKKHHVLDGSFVDNWWCWWSWNPPFELHGNQGPR